LPVGILPERWSASAGIPTIEHFKKSTHWVIDRWWNLDEKRTIGIEESFKLVNKQEIDALVDSLNDSLKEYDIFAKENKITLENTTEIKLGNTSLFNLFIGKRIVKKELPDLQGDIPAYSANVFEPFGYISKTNITDFERPSILWAIDSNFGFNLFPAGNIFATTDHCGTIQILDDNIIPEFLLYALTIQKIEESFDRSFRASLANIRRFSIKIPVLEDGTFDIETQKKIADYFVKAEEKKSRLNVAKEELNEAMANYILSNEYAV
jgi:restriction endonuclease S subunit